MKKRIIIRFPADRSPDFYTSVFHFAESMWHDIVNAKLGTLNNIDRGREIVWVDVSANRHAGAIKQIIKKTLARHKLLNEAHIEIDETPDPATS